MFFAEIIFRLGAYYRNKSLFRIIDEMRRENFASRNSLEKRKYDKLEKLLDHAVRQVPYYEKYKACGKDPKEWLGVFPILTKTDILNNQEKINNCVGQEKHFLSETSGTTGEALVFYKNESWDTINRASAFNGYAWYNVKPWERNGVFWGYSFTPYQKVKTRILDLLQNRFRLFSYEEQEVNTFLKKLKKASYIHGYSSMIYEVACIGEKLGYKPSDFPKMKMIKGTSEKIYPFYNEVIKRVFGMKMISEYGAAETGIIAFECPNGHMHINEENVIVENIDGEIVVTNLNSYSFPIIRYKLGDAVKMAPYTSCSCGRKSNIILEIEGRVGKAIYGFNNKYPSLMLYYIFKNLALHSNLKLQYQAYQNVLGKMDIRIPIELTKSEEELILKECNAYFKNDVHVNVCANTQIHLKKGKLKDFITELE